MDRPVTQTLQQAELIKQRAQFGVVAVAERVREWARDAATGPQYYFRAVQIEQYPDGTWSTDAFYGQFFGLITSTCRVVTASEWQTSVPPERAADDVGLIYPVVGQVILQNDSGQRYEAAILAENNQLRFSVAVPPGQYFLSGFLFYRGDDAALRLYNSLYLVSENTSVDYIPVNAIVGTTFVDVALRLNDGANVCAVNVNEL
jgi:hypothetical protein